MNLMQQQLLLPTSLSAVLCLCLQGNPLTWVVVDVSQQRDFRSAYGFTADQLPALVALSTKRMRFAQGAAPFSEHSAKQLVTKVLAGSAVTLPLPVCCWG